jgi:ElaB/YqjD/DUF883 family membrane-anchored ribosome-binding protein
MEPLKTDSKNSYDNDIKNKFQAGEKTLMKVSHDTGERIGSMATRISDSATDYVKSSQAYIKQNPTKSVAMAAAAGIVAGSLISFVSRRRN